MFLTINIAYIHLLFCSLQGAIQNFPDWCRHLYSNCGSANNRWMVGLPCLVSQCAKLHVAGWTWAVFTRVFLESCTWPVAILTMDQRKEQRVCIKFCANLGKSATETLTMMQQAFGDESLSHTQVFQWHARFRTGRTSVDDDDEHTGRPTSCTNPEIQELFRQDRRWTIHDIAEEVGIGYGTCQLDLT
jgi:transposase